MNRESEITMVGVAGCGVMGAGIAELCTRSGRDVRVVSRRRSVPAAQDRIAGSLNHRLRRGRIGQADYDAVLGRLSFTDDLTALADRELIFEAVPEDPATKTRVLAALGSGGVIQVAEEFNGLSRTLARRRVGKVYDTTKRVLALAADEGVSPATAADRLAERLIAEARPHPGSLS